MPLTPTETINLRVMIKAPEVWSIDTKGTISRRCRLSVPVSKPTGVWGSASFVGHDEKLIACAEDGEYIT